MFNVAKVINSEEKSRGLTLSRDTCACVKPGGSPEMNFGEQVPPLGIFTKFFQTGGGLEKNNQIFPA